MKQKKKRNPVAFELLCSGKYNQRVVKNKKLYSRKEKHKKTSKNKFEVFYFHALISQSASRIRFQSGFAVPR